MAHTPGPWILEITDSLKEGDWVIRDPSGTAIMGDTPYYPWHSNNYHDAVLHAAGPDMLAALKSAIELSDRMLTDAGRTDECQAVYDECVLAVRKAEGL